MCKVFRTASTAEPSSSPTPLSLLTDEDGATAIEYGVIAALTTVAAVTVMGTIGTNLSSTFNTVANSL
jgi:pilus assembly protein Flp/PilA